MIENLPNEVLHGVLRQLPLPDLKSCRLLSRNLTQIPREHIFRHVKVIIHSGSASRLAAIAGHEKICQEVRSLSFDLRIVRHSDFVFDFCRWWDTCSQIGKRNCPDFEGRGLYSEFSTYLRHMRYTTFVRDQNQLAALGLEFCSKCENLPNIAHLEVTGGAGHTSEVPTTQDFMDFKALWPRIGTAPYWKGTISSYRHTEMMLTAGLRNRIFLTSLAIIGIDWDFLNCVTVERLAQWRDQMKPIRQLKLYLRLPNPKPGIMSLMQDHEQFVDEYAQFLCSPAKLETLDFAFIVAANRNQHEMPWTWYGYERHQFQAILERPTFMHHIRELRFAEFVFSPNEFTKLLSHNEARTLKKLEFHKIHLTEGTWLVFLRQLAHAADLEHFSLSGWISSEHEGWNALTQEQAAEYYGADVERIYPHQRDKYDYSPDCLVHCEAFEEWTDQFEPLPEKWCIRTLIEDWVTSGGGTRRTINTNDHPDDPSKWAGWSPLAAADDDKSATACSPSPPETWHDDSFPLMQGYLPACPVHHAPTPERQKQYRYESRWRTHLNRDFTFVWAEDLVMPVRGRGQGSRRRRWKPCPASLGERKELCPVRLGEDGYVVPEEMVCDDAKEELVVRRGHMVTVRRS